MKNVSAIIVLTLTCFLNATGQIKIACIGNSITQGFGLQNPTTQAYPARLQALLGTTYKVENDGVSGKTLLKNGDQSYWTQGRLTQVFAFKPNIVTIKLGTNDTKPQNWDMHNAEFKWDYLAMIDTLNTLPTKPKIFLVLPVPIWKNGMGIRDSALQKIIVIIKQVANERGLPIIDCNTPLLNFPQYFPDGVHPNSIGADSIAHIIYRALTKPPVSTVADLQKHGSGVTSRIVSVSGRSIPEVLFFIPDNVQVRAVTFELYDCKGALVWSSHVERNGFRAGVQSLSIRPNKNVSNNSGIYLLKMMTTGQSGRTFLTGTTKFTLSR
jgi:alpha-L-fucosidase 2